jgi:hypothetical protein
MRSVGRASVLPIMITRTADRQSPGRDAERIAEFWSYQQSRTLAELLSDCEGSDAPGGAGRHAAGKEARHPGAVVEPAQHGEPAVLRRKSPTVRHIGRDRLAMLDRW